jgi:hypothetical protein
LPRAWTHAPLDDDDDDHTAIWTLEGEVDQESCEGATICTDGAGGPFGQDPRLAKMGCAAVEVAMSATGHMVVRDATVKLRHAPKHHDRREAQLASHLAPA